MRVCVHACMWMRTWVCTCVHIGPSQTFLFMDLFKETWRWYISHFLHNSAGNLDFVSFVVTRPMRGHLYLVIFGKQLDWSSLESELVAQRPLRQEAAALSTCCKPAIIAHLTLGHRIQSRRNTLFSLHIFIGFYK